MIISEASGCCEDLPLCHTKTDAGNNETMLWDTHRHRCTPNHRVDPPYTGSVHVHRTAGCTNVRLCCVETQLSTIDPKHLLLQLQEQQQNGVCVCVCVCRCACVLPTDPHKGEPPQTFLQMQQGSSWVTCLSRSKEYSSNGFKNPQKDPQLLSRHLYL